MLKLLRISFLIILLMTTPVFAGSTSINSLFDAKLFQITGGLTKDSEVTFDDKRNIVGTASKGTIITINIYKLVPSTNDKDTSTNELVDSYDITVGSSGIFTQMIELSLDENIISIVATHGNDSATKTFTIKRKPVEIKVELEKTIILPAYKIPTIGDVSEKQS